MLLPSVSVLLSIVYTWLIFVGIKTWRDRPASAAKSGHTPEFRVTVLIPTRNEGAKLQRCIDSINNGTYPASLLEIMVLDDFSDPPAGCRGAHRVIRLNEHLPETARHDAHKKQAISIGVAEARGKLILCTDADVVAPPDWVKRMCAPFQDPECQMVCAPVNFTNEQNLLQGFQSLDFIGMMGITGLGHWRRWFYMANGANLAYRKSAFEAVGGYAGNQHIASGDDMFLAQKIAQQWPGSTRFLSETAATVHTEAPHSLRAFWQQRLRWGSKNAQLNNRRLQAALLLVYLYCMLILVCAAGAFFVPGAWYSLVLLLGVKYVADYYWLRMLCRFFGREELMRYYTVSGMLHVLYIALVGTASLLGKAPAWKEN